MGIAALILSAAFADHEARDHGRVERAAVLDAAARTTRSVSAAVDHASGNSALARQTGRCTSTSGIAGYVNPLAHARVTAERIDQGVDYAGSGALVALGTGRLSYVGKSRTGWPGAFIEYQLLSGPEAGCFVYYAEGVNPAPGLHVGEAVGPGKTLASIIPGWSSGVELGWGAGVSTETYAAKAHQWSAQSDADSVASAPGKDFSAMIASLGGPPGRVERHGHVR